jgi:hypothetical protein
MDGLLGAMRGEGCDELCSGAESQKLLSLIKISQADSRIL